MSESPKTGCLIKVAAKIVILDREEYVLLRV